MLLGSRQRGAEAVVDARAERHLRLTRRLSSDVERLGVGVHRRVTVGDRQRRSNERAFRKQDTLVLDVDARDPAGAAHRTEVTHRFFHRTGSEFGLIGQELPLIGVVGEQCDRAAELVARGVGTAHDHGLNHHHEFVLAQLVAGFLGGDEAGDQVVSRLVASVGDQLPGVFLEFGLGLDDSLGLLGGVRIEDSQDVLGPDAERLPVALGGSEEFADDRDRVRIAHIGHQVASAGLRDLIEQVVENLAHEGSESVGRSGSERRRDEPAQARMNIALRRQDRLASILEQSWIGDAVECRDESGGIVPALVAQDRLAVLVREHQMGECAAGDPGLLSDSDQSIALFLGVGEDEVDRGDVEFVNEGGHGRKPSVMVVA